MVGSKNILIEKRKELQEWLKRCLIGPFSGNSGEILHSQPSSFYACGYLSGQWPEGEQVIEDEEINENNNAPMFAVGNNEDKSKKADGVKKNCRYKPPSAIGLSFFVSEDIQIDVMMRGARYKKAGGSGSKKETWTRRQLPLGEDKFEFISISRPENDADLEFEYSVLYDQELCDNEDIKLKDGHSSKLHTRWRPYSFNKNKGYILTISLVNTAICNSIDYKIWEQTHLFQIEFNCFRQKGEIYPYPKLEISPLCNDLEDRQLDLIYNDKKIYAIGHSVSLDWKFENEKEQIVKSIHADFMPTCEVPLMKFSIDGLEQSTFQLKKLVNIVENIRGTQKKLKEFLLSYEGWLRNLDKKKDLLSKDEQESADMLITEINKNHNRILAGIELLGTNKNASKAFAFAHQAMIDYMSAWAKQTGGSNKNPSWRPFQLAFLLLTMPSLVNKDCIDRDIVDLLWFQTGGGKTEAYLAIIAFLICYRRMEYGEDGYGTTVIMRYTLRLLTMQQFQRASILTCALELIRRSKSEFLGDAPITTGLWVGGSTSPNNYKRAIEYVMDDKFEQLVVTECPWCGSSFNRDNFIYGQDQFHFICKNKKCDFFDDVLPINVVDDALYDNPPTLLFSTVDKFAMFAWQERAGRFLGSGNNKPPDLIIQDELHLISSELGSITGVYEAAFDTVLKIKGCHPKYIASTATIRNAKDQITKLYARNVNIFPPPGLNWSDSFFARVDKEKPGRLYIGYNSPFISRSHSFAPLAASLMIAPSTWDSDDESVIDAWWTLVAYHGSLRGLGITQTLFSDEVQHYIQSIIFHMCNVELRELSDRTGQKIFETFDSIFNDVKSDKDAFYQFLMKRRINAEQGIVQLTSNRTPSEIRRYLEALSCSYSSQSNSAITAVLSTNMVSVGLDISRLGLMVINGQPFTTGEYIQASSRVGRGDVPGIVVAHYFRNNSRDLSHFENFRAYHESFYRFVEPTSLTPFSEPAIKRALHAALVIVVRHACGLAANNTASHFEPENINIRNAIELLKERCINASPEHKNEIELYLERLINEWHKNKGGRFNKLTYKRENRSNCLMVGHEEQLRITPDQIPWKTMYSVRQVDDECGIRFVSPK